MKNFDEKMAELNYFADVWGLSIEDALAELLFTYYEAAGFDCEILANELYSKSDEELMKLYLNT